MVSILLAAGASAAATDEDGKTPLVWAASQGHETAVGRQVGKRRLCRVPAAWPPFFRPSACEANTDDCGPRSARGRSTRAAQRAVGGPLVQLAGLVGRSILQIDNACARCIHARPG